MITGMYCFKIGSFIVEADVTKHSEDEHEIQIKNVNGEDSSNFTKLQLQLIEKQVALKLYEMWSN